MPMVTMPAFIRLLLAGGCAALLAACQSATPMSRISQNPVMFRTLPPDQQVLVQQGRICEGMSKDAVFLAWGNPNTTPVTGQRDGVAYEKWVYLIYQPLMMNSVSIGGGCWRHGHWHSGGIGSSTVYVPEEASWVMFEHDKVTSWETRK